MASDDEPNPPVLTEMQQMAAMFKEFYDSLRFVGFSWKEACYIIAVQFAIGASMPESEEG